MLTCAGGDNSKDSRGLLLEGGRDFLFYLAGAMCEKLPLYSFML